VTRIGLARLAASVALSVAVGAACGVGGYAFIYARGASYLTDDPAACANCQDGELAAARAFQRQAQFRIDFVEAENSVGFHAPQEAARILGEAIDLVRKGQMALRPGAR